MGSRLERIRRQLLEIAKDAPYHFCNRRCEQCPRTGDCKVYQDEFDSKLQNMADGVDPSADSLSGKKQINEEEMLRELAEEEGIDLESGDSETYQHVLLQEKSLYRHPLYKDSDAYCLGVDKFIKQTTSEGSREATEDEDYKTIDWFHAILPGKAHRALCGLYVGSGEEEEEKLLDAVAQLDLCKAAAEESRGAFEGLLERRPSLRFEITHLTDLLESILWGIKTLEEDIEAGILPAS